MKTIKIFMASSFSYTPFDNFVDGDLAFLNSNGIAIVSTIDEADIIISQNYKHLKKYFWRFLLCKKFLIWTLEPRFDISFLKVKKYLFGLIKVHYMNIYTNDVFVSNLTFTIETIKGVLPLVQNDISFSKKIIALMSYYKGVNAPELIRDAKNIDLIALRNQIAVEGHELGILDVYGKGWPDGISKEDSREGNWFGRKLELLKMYGFNLCFENTIAPNYMTEKIWDSIKGYNLPIYYAKGTTAYEIFPENSFIDYAKFKNPKELFDFIASMDKTDYLNRLNKCLNVYNSISAKGDNFAKEERLKMLNKIVEKLHSIY